MSHRHVGLLLLAGLSAFGCDSKTEQEPSAGQSALSPELARGKEVWEANCQVCHGPGLAGAPPKGDQEAWAARIESGMETLVQHARDGYSGPGGHQMPARGGNPDLSDNDLAAAVAYMVSQSQ